MLGFLNCSFQLSHIDREVKQLNKEKQGADQPQGGDALLHEPVSYTHLNHSEGSASV